MSISPWFFEAPNLKNRALASTGAWFLQNRRFRKRYEKNIILALFFEAEAKKIRIKIASNMCCFKAPHFERFFFNFGCILESKNLCKITKFRDKLRFGGSFWSTVAFELLFGRMLRFLEFDFGWFWSLQGPFFGPRVTFAETCVDHLRLQECADFGYCSSNAFEEPCFED